jgi:hypothetical protein
MRGVRFWPFFWIGCLKEAKEFVQEQATENVARQPQPYRMEDKAGKAAELLSGGVIGDIQKSLRIRVGGKFIPLAKAGEQGTKERRHEPDHRRA